MTDTKYMLAADGGGSKTEFVLLSSDGEVINRLTLGGSNPNVCGIEQTYKILSDGIEQVNTQKLKISAVFAGVAGLGNEKNRRYVTEYLSSLLPSAAVKCQTDIYNLLGCEEESEGCIFAILGTGSVVYAYSGGELHRLGGWGYLLEEGGSGFSIGRDALRAALAEDEGMGEKTLISELLQGKLGGSVWDNIGEIYSKGSKYIASFAPAVFEAYLQKDAAASEILNKNIGTLAHHIKIAVEKYGCRKALLSGGLTQNSAVLSELFEKHLGDIEIKFQQLPQVYGAAIQSLRLCGCDTAEVRKRLKSQF